MDGKRVKADWISIKHMLHTMHRGLFAMSVDMNRLAKCVSLCIFDLQGGFTLGKNVVKAKTTGSLEFFSSHLPCGSSHPWIVEPQ